MGGNIPGGSFLGGEFSWGKFTRGSLIGGNFPGYRKKYMQRILKFTSIDIDLHQKNLHSPNP